MSSLQKKAIAGSIWVLISYGGSQFLRLVANLILTRLLVPELFGLMTLANTFIIGLQLFSDISVATSIIRSDRGDDPKFLNTAWTIQIIRGCLLWIGCWIIAFPASQFYQERQFVWLIPIIGFSSCFLDGFKSISLMILSRNLEIKKESIINLSTQIITLSVMIIWAYFQPTIWALVIGNIISQIVILFWSFKISSIRHQITWDKKAVDEIFSFGKWIFVSTAVTFVASQSDKLMLGKFLPLEILGIYTVALAFAEIPHNIVFQISIKIIFPLMSKKSHLPLQELQEKIRKKRKWLLIFSALIISCIFCFGDWLIFFLYDERYRKAGWILPLLSLGLWPLVLSLSIDRILYVIGKPFYQTIGTFFKFIYMIILFPLALTKGSLLLGIIVIAFNDIPTYILTNYGLWREGFLNLRQDIICTFILILLLVVLIGIRYVITNDFPTLLKL